ncbi:MAG: HD domain-containing protein [Candidatus Brocadiales bacterium]|nr:HD domain-containing protein [Candidatus Brocadiales bacterium]
MLEQVKQFVQQSFDQGINDKCTKHFEQTLYWVKQLKPDADEPVLIAAYAHDTARAFRTQNTEETFKNKEFNDPEILKEHQYEGASMVSDFLNKEGYDEESIKRVFNMIGHHEEGGDAESNLVMDADSISYLEIIAIRHIELSNSLGKEKIKRKIDWMYKRVSSDKAKALATPYYKKAIISFLKYK